MRSETPNRQSGFSLIELLVAMLITLIVSGAIYGLLAQGQNAFRREPALADRQQQIRVAMDMIQKDVATAGMLVPPFMQVFTRNLNGFGASAPYTSANSPFTGVKTDALEIYGNSGVCPSLTICPGTFQGAQTKTMEDYTKELPCFQLPALVIYSNNAGQSDIEWGCPPGGAQVGGCNNGGHIAMPPGKDPRFNDPPGKPGGFSWTSDPTDAAIIQVVRYEIQVGADGVPNLMRSPTGGVNPGDGCGGKAGGGGGTSAWWLVARGIEDMQVEYSAGDGLGWQPQPPEVCKDLGGATCDTKGATPYASLVRQVRVTLSARVFDEANLGIETQPGAAATRGVRGSLASVTSPRMALFTLSQAPNLDPQQWQ